MKLSKDPRYIYIQKLSGELFVTYNKIANYRSTYAFISHYPYEKMPSAGQIPEEARRAEVIYNAYYFREPAETLATRSIASPFEL